MKSTLPKIGLAWLPAGLSLAFCACLGLTDEKPAGGGQNRSAHIRLVPIREPAAPVGAALARKGAGNTADGLESFQVAVSAIQIVKDVDLTGTGTHNPVDPVMLFSNPALSDRSTVDTTHAIEEGQDADYIDFMTAAGLQKLSTSSTFFSQNVGAYNFVLVNWAMAFRVRAAINIGGGQTVYTKQGTLDAQGWQVHAASSMFQGPAETVKVSKNNGGTWFHFLKPLEIRESDLNTTVMVHDTMSHLDSLGHAVPFDTLVPAGQLSVLLLFSPEAYLSAWDSSHVTSSMTGGQEMAELTGPDGMGNIHVPALDATAIPYRQGEEVWRETYVFTGDHPQNPGQEVRTRLELYTIGDNIVGIHLRGLSGSAGGPPVDPPGAFFVDRNAAGLITVQDWNHAAILNGFKTLPYVGDADHTDFDFGYMKVTGAEYTLLERIQLN